MILMIHVQQFENSEEQGWLASRALTDYPGNLTLTIRIMIHAVGRRRLFHVFIW